jgi:hypothetical protein
METLFYSEYIASVPLAKFVLWSVGLVLVSLCFLYLSYRNFKKARLIEDMPTSLIRSASQGFTELIGIARISIKPLPAPLTGVPCLWWKYSIEKFERSGNSSSWTIIESGTSEAPFNIEDDTGLCIVMPRGADLSARHSRLWRGRDRYLVNAPTNSSSLSASQLALNIGFGKRYRYTEHLIKDGDPLYILGNFETDSSGQRSMSVEKITGNILRSWKRDFSRLVKKYDQNSDGQLDLDEWEVVKQAARAVALEQKKAHSTVEAPHQISKPGEGGLPFVIAGEDQEKLSRRYRIKALTFSAGFLSFGSAATWYISARGL